MATFTTRFLGCKVSFADEQAIRERLLGDGHTEAATRRAEPTWRSSTPAASPTRRSQSRARRRRGPHARTTASTSPAAPPTSTGKAFAGLPDNVRLVSRRSEEVAEAVAGDVGAIGCVRADHRLDRVRAFVKIQDGCSFACAFCVIPLVRGGTRSRAAAAVLSEIHRRVAQGHREVVLTGVNLGCFRDREARLTLAGLIRRAGAIEGLERLRLSSIEVNHVTPALVAAMRETPNVSPHLHIPLQSGDDAVLRAMGRRYTIGQFRKRIDGLEDFNLTTDVIVGFPTEDEQAFGNTMNAVAAAGVTKVHVFPYSPRPGTRTAADDPVAAAVKKDRSARLRAASDAACRARWQRRVGSEDVVLLDKPGGGYADDYTPWLVDGAVGEMVRARAVGVRDEGVLAVAA